VFAVLSHFLLRTSKEVKTKNFQENEKFDISFCFLFISSTATKMKRKIAQVAGEAKSQALEQQKTKQDAPAQASAAGGLTKSQKKRQRKKQRSQEVQQAAPATAQPTKQVGSPRTLYFT
jgi:hypothetical protein